MTVDAEHCVSPPFSDCPSFNSAGFPGTTTVWHWRCLTGALSVIVVVPFSDIVLCVVFLSVRGAGWISVWILLEASIHTNRSCPEFSGSYSKQLIVSQRCILHIYCINLSQWSWALLSERHPYEVILAKVYIKSGSAFFYAIWYDM